MQNNCASCFGGDLLKKITFGMLIITLIMFIGLNFFSDSSIANVVYTDGDKRDAYLNIMTCNKQQCEMVKEIVGNKHNIQFMFANENSIAEFKYNTETVNNISNMVIFLYSGNSYEPWVSEFIEDLDKSKLGVINISRGIRTIQFEGRTSKNNPYFWTGVDEYKIALYNIKSAIQDKDPKNRDLYEQNYEKVIKELDEKLVIYGQVNVDFSQFEFIALDDNLDYFFRNIGISPIKAKDKTIATIIEENHLEPQKVIILKDIKTPFNKESYKVIELESFDDNKTFNDIIINNYYKMYSITPNEQTAPK